MSHKPEKPKQEVFLSQCLLTYDFRNLTVILLLSFSSIIQMTVNLCPYLPSFYLSSGIMPPFTHHRHYLKQRQDNETYTHFQLILNVSQNMFLEDGCKNTACNKWYQKELTKEYVKGRKGEDEKGLDRSSLTFGETSSDGFKFCCLRISFLQVVF